MINIKKIFFVFALTPLVFSACNHTPVDEKAVAFSMSDTMYASCKFYDAAMQQVKSDIRLFGKITADNNKMSSVYPVVGGSVLQINVELGDYVHQGDVLAVIRSGEVAEFQKERLNALNDVAIAEKNLQVAKDLFAGKLNSERDVAAAKSELEKSKAELSRITDVYSIYSLKNGSIYNILAPLSGFIITKNINKNEQIRADKNDALFSIADIKDVWAIANVNESDIAKVKLGYEADVVTISFPDDIYKGKVDKIFNTIDPETKAMKIRVKIPNADLKLKPDMEATVTLRFNEDKKMIAVPSASVIFDKSKYWVMVFKNRNNIETRRVEVYRQVGDTSYISSGLSPNEKVISKNGIFIYDELND